MISSFVRTRVEIRALAITATLFVVTMIACVGNAHAIAPINVNFQKDMTEGVPAGYLPDLGDTYADRGNGYVYGWSQAMTLNMRNRNNTASPDNRYDTLAGMADVGLQVHWDIGVPNGNYRVRIVVGDPTYFGSRNQWDIEGVRAVDWTSSSAVRWYENTVNTTVTDGKLTFIQGPSASGGNVDFVEITDLGTSDTTPPTVTITAPANGSRQASTSASATFSANESASFQCQLDGGTLAACTSPKSYTGLSAGSHTITVQATDAAGNVGTSATTFTVDNVGPVTTIASPVNGSFVKTTTVSATFSANEAATFKCKLDSGSYAACTSPKSYSALSQASHTISVQATDSLGNVGAAVSSSFTVDTTAPVVSITGPTANQKFSTRSIATAFTVSETGSTAQCKLDSGAYAPCTTGYTFSGVGDGTHTISVLGTDRAGNTATATRTFSVDATVPTVTITSPLNGAYLRSTSLSAAWTVSETGTTVQCKLDAASFASCTSPKAYSALAQGSHSFTVKSTDGYGNVGTTVSSFTVDTSAPIVTISSPAAGQTITSSSVPVSFSANESASFQCKIDSGVLAACTSPTTFTGLANGSHTAVVQATDLAGNASAAASRSFTVSVSSPPALSATVVDFAHVDLSWTNTPSGLTRIDIYRDGQKVGQTLPSASTYRDAQLWYTTTYSYTVNFMNGTTTVASIGPVSATTTAMPGGTFPKEFPNSTYYSSQLNNPAPLTCGSGSGGNCDYATYVAWVGNHPDQNPNMILRSWGVTIYETHPGDQTISNFGCVYGGAACSVNGQGPIPVPFDAQPDGGAYDQRAGYVKDNHMALVDRSRNLQWEFFRPSMDAPGSFIQFNNGATSPTFPWSGSANCTNAAATCPWGVSATVVDLAGNSIIPSANTGADAANMPLLAGLIRPEEIAQGHIDHALALTVPGIGADPAMCPATHRVTTNAQQPSGYNPAVNGEAPPEGARFRLDPSVDVAAISLSAANEWQRIVLYAMQRYGMYVRDNSGQLGIAAETTTSTLGGRHYDGWIKTGVASLSNPSSGSVGLRAYPWWSHLVALNPPC